MTDYEDRMNKEGKFIEANLASQKISELKRTKDLKIIKSAENRQIEEKNVLENKQYNELNQFNEEMDEKFKQLNDRFASLQSQLFDKHQNEIKQYIEKFENETNRTTPKPSKELITLNKQMDLYAKKKDYQNAHDIQVKIMKLSKKEKEGFLKQRASKLNQEIQNIKQRQANEMTALSLKLENQYNEFKKERAINLEKIFLKYKIQVRGLTEAHQHEKNCFEKILNGKANNMTIRPLSNIPSNIS